MDRRSEFAAGHLGFCLAEMLAEIDDQLSRHAAARALEQLEARELAGEPVTTVDAASLRHALLGRIAADPRSIARRKLLEINALLITGTGSGAEPRSAGKVVDLTAFRQEQQAASQPSSRPRSLRRVAGAVSGLAILALASFASASSLSWIGRVSGFEIVTVFSRPNAATPASRVGIVDAH
jgi:hypothetical protein